MELKKIGVNPSSFQSNVQETVKAYPKVSGGQPYLGNSLNTVLQKAESLKTDFGDTYVSVELLFLALVAGNDSVDGLLKNAGLNVEIVKNAIKELRGNRKVNDQHAEGTYQSLEKYGKNLNELAKAGKIDPVIGRDEEIRRVLQILTRRTKNNPMLVGEPGAGKTAIAEGLAHRIVDGDVPENLKDKIVYSSRFKRWFGNCQ